MPSTYFNRKSKSGVASALIAESAEEVVRCDYQRSRHRLLQNDRDITSRFLYSIMDLLSMINSGVIYLFFSFGQTVIQMLRPSGLRNGQSGLANRQT
jgi:hypothetical protein